MDRTTTYIVVALVIILGVGALIYSSAHRPGTTSATGSGTGTTGTTQTAPATPPSSPPAKTP